MASAAAANAGAAISFTIYDDGSTDGTTEALSLLPHNISILQGDGTAYWAQSMARAESAVLSLPQESKEEYVVWLNDDVRLDPDAFTRLAETIRARPGAVVIGAMRDSTTGEVTYSGMRRRGLHPLGFEMVPPSALPQKVDTFNGNFIAVPYYVAKSLRGIDGGFAHAFADIDYGLRCGQAGVEVVLGPFTYGSCDRNAAPSEGRALDDWKAFTGPKGGGNFNSVKRFLSKGHPKSWIVFVAATYGRWWAHRLAATLRKWAGVRG